MVPLLPVKAFSNCHCRLCLSQAPLYQLRRAPEIGSRPEWFHSVHRGIAEIIRDFSISSHQYADDTALLSQIPLADISACRVSIVRCLLAVRNWFRSRWFQLNTDKTELVMVRHEVQHWQHSLCRHDEYVTCVKHLGVFLDTEFNMKRQINCIAGACFFQLRRLRQLRNVISPQPLQRVVSALILPRLDCYSNVLTGLPAS